MPNKNWEDIDRFGVNRLEPRATFQNFATAAEAIAAHGGASPRTVSLDGTWKFDYSDDATVAPEGFEAAGFDDSAWGEIPVPSCWQMFGHGAPHYTNVQYPIPLDAPLEMVKELDQLELDQRTTLQDSST